MRVLVIEDDAETARYIAKGLGESGYAVDVANDGKDGLLLAVGEDYDLAVIDRMLPSVDGLSIVETMRGAGRETPVLRAHGKHRAVPVPAGEHRVVLRYRPPGLRVGVGLSGLSLLVAVGLWAVPLRRRP